MNKSYKNMNPSTHKTIKSSVFRDVPQYIKEQAVFSNDGKDNGNE
ncbi:hypothetical protein [Vibrio methylphosphonaticus]|nr:hypothetical protein [Vibrio methylphosphonaticus]